MAGISKPGIQAIRSLFAFAQNALKQPGLEIDLHS